jgi:hypothetical protein
MANSVKVPQKDGTITIRRGLLPPKTYKVDDHIVKVTNSDLEHFLRAVVDAKEVKDTDETRRAKEGKV